MSVDELLRNTTIGFIGAGNMAQAIGIGLIKTGKVKASNVFASAPSENNFGPWKAAGAKVTCCNLEVVVASDVIFFSVKPQQFDLVVEQLLKQYQMMFNGDAMEKRKIVVSIMAGITLEQIYEGVNSLFRMEPTYIRVMPNTPISVGVGCSVLCHSAKTKEEDVALVKAIMEAGGICSVVPEKYFSAFGALCGSGPAFMYLVIEAMADAGVKLGISRVNAIKFAAQTMMGSASLVLESGQHPGALKDAVCSPGGTTICGMHELERGMVRASFMNAIEAAAKRSEELSKK